jgi:hypothetical protein
MVHVQSQQLLAV